MLLSTIILSSIMIAGSVMPVYAGTNSNVNEILSLMPGATIEEVEASIKETANSLGKSEEEVSVQILNELKTQEELNKEEQKEIRQAGHMQEKVIHTHTTLLQTDQHLLMALKTVLS